MRNSMTPGPTLGIGFQSLGSKPFCTRWISCPALRLASSGKALRSSSAEPNQTTGFSAMREYTKFDISRQAFQIAGTVIALGSRKIRYPQSAIRNPKLSRPSPLAVANPQSEMFFLISDCRSLMFVSQLFALSPMRLPLCP